MSIRPVLLSSGLGLALPLAFAPFDLWPLALILVAAALRLWRNLSPSLAMRAGFGFGFGAFLAGTYWLYISIVGFGKAPVWLALFLMIGLVLIMAIYYALTAWVIARSAVVAKSLGVWIALCVSTWVFAEWLRGWILSGFPWISLGYSQLDSPLAGIAPVLGTYGVSAFVVIIAAAVAHLKTPWRERSNFIAIFVVVAALVGGQALRSVDFVETGSQSLQAAIIQGGVGQDEKWLRSSFQPTLDLYRTLTEANLDADVIVWPEVALPATRDQVSDYLARLDRTAGAANVALALGVLEFSGEPRTIHNAMITLGNASGSFRKHHLVPFGEYFPVPNFVREWMRLRSLPYADMSAGPAKQPPINLAGHAVATSICYEDAFASEQQHFFPAARFIVNITNDAWFGDSIAPHHHLDIARMRSLESRRWQLRAANTGVTAIIDPQGRVSEAIPQFQAGVVRGTLYPASGSTPYLVLGNPPLISLCFAVLLFFAWRQRRV